MMTLAGLVGGPPRGAGLASCRPEVDGCSGSALRPAADPAGHPRAVRQQAAPQHTVVRVCRRLERTLPLALLACGLLASLLRLLLAARPHSLRLVARLLLLLPFGCLQRTGGTRTQCTASVKPGRYG